MIKFTKNKAIFNVWDTPSVVGEDLYFLENKSINVKAKEVRKLSLESLLYKEIKNVSGSSLSFYRNLAMIYDGTESVVRFYNVQSWEFLKELPEFQLLSWKKKESFIFFYSKNDASVVEIDLSTFDIIGRIPHRIANVTKFYNKVFFTEVNILSPTSLYCYESGFKRQYWQVNLSEKRFDNIPSGERYFGRDFFCYDDTIIVRIGDFAYCGLKIDTGEVKWMNQDFRTAELQDGKLLSLGGRRFVIVDAASGITELFISLEEEMAALNMYAISKFTLSDSYIYFKDGRGKLGIFSIEERKIIWHHDLNTPDQKIEFGATEAPVVAGNKLMMLDLNHTLHVFERDD